MKTCDIIIPIYNAYEYTRDCIQSVLQYTDLKKHCLILIDDASPDERIVELLKKTKKDNKQLNIEVVYNKKNQGFVKNVNLGMKMSDHDVILLNSDTEVTERWLEKMMECAYSRKEIATVTPLTNNGSIAAIPNFVQDNKIPDGYTTQTYAKLIEEISFKEYPELTTGVGFCMFIKREALDEVGYFDADAYGIGYGEETDFCYRALDYGYVHVLCDDTFIYHKGTQSFKEKYDEVYDKNMQFLINRYQKYNDLTNEFVLTNPLKNIQDNIKLNLYRKQRKNVLYTIHSWIKNHDTKGAGGTTLHLWDIIQENRNFQNSYVLVPVNNGHYQLYCYIGEYETVLDYYIPPFKNQLHFLNSNYEKMLETIVKVCNIELIHVQHTIGHSFSIMNVIKKYHLYSIITLHDFYYYCPAIHLMYQMKQYCEETETDTRCQSCINHEYKIDNNIITKFRRLAYEYLQTFDLILTPSNDTKKRYQKYYKKLKIEVLEHGVDSFQTDYYPTYQKTFHIAFIGIIGVHKGSQILKDMIRAAHPNIHIHLFGGSDDSFLTQNHRGYTYHGLYKKSDLPKLLSENSIHLICLLSVWPETYSYTLTESILSHVPVIAFDIGAIGERVKRLKCGFLVELGSSSSSIMQKIVDIKSDFEQYDKVVQNIMKLKLKTVEEMGNEYHQLYQKSKPHHLECTVEERYDVLNQHDSQNTDQTQEMYFTLARYDNLIRFYERLRKSRVVRGVIRVAAPVGRKLIRKD